MLLWKVARQNESRAITTRNTQASREHYCEQRKSRLSVSVAIIGRMYISGYNSKF